MIMLMPGPLARRAASGTVAAQLPGNLPVTKGPIKCHRRAGAGWARAVADAPVPPSLVLVLVRPDTARLRSLAGLASPFF